MELLPQLNLQKSRLLFGHKLVLKYIHVCSLIPVFGMVVTIVSIFYAELHSILNIFENE